MTMTDHDPPIHTALIAGNPALLMEKHDRKPSKEFMRAMAEKIRSRIDELGLKQNDVASKAGLSAQRFGNYCQGKRAPDVETLARISVALQTSTDWLLGLSSAAPVVDVAPVVVRLLELDGLQTDRAEAIAATVQEALSILSALPPEGDDRLRSRMAAQAAWQSRRGAKPD